MVGQRRPSDEEVEFAALLREQHGFLQQVRMEALQQRLSRGRALAVRYASFGFCGDRLKALLDDGTLLKLRLYCPSRRRSLAALSSVAWNDNVGWVAQGRSAGGHQMELRAWLAEVSFVRRGPTTKAFDPAFD